MRIARTASGRHPSSQRLTSLAPSRLVAALNDPQNFLPPLPLLTGRVGAIRARRRRITLELRCRHLPAPPDPRGSASIDLVPRNVLVKVLRVVQRVGGHLIVEPLGRPKGSEGLRPTKALGQVGDHAPGNEAGLIVPDSHGDELLRQLLAPGLLRKRDDLARRFG